MAMWPRPLVPQSVMWPSTRVMRDWFWPALLLVCVGITDYGRRKHQLVKVMQCNCMLQYLRNLEMGAVTFSISSVVLFPWKQCIEFFYLLLYDWFFHAFTLPSTVPTCGQLSRPVNGALSLSSGVSEGSVATYTCDTGFNLTGSTTRTCASGGGWTPAAPVCLTISML